MKFSLNVFVIQKNAPAKAPTIVVPRIKHLNFLKAMDAIPGITDRSRPISEPLVGDLFLTYAIDIGASYEAVNQATLEKYNLQQSGLQSLAKANALIALSKIKTKTDGTVHELTAGDNMAACSILFPELWQQIEQQIGGDIIAAFPHRDAVFYVRADAPNAVEALKKAISQINFAETHALSQLLYRRVTGQWCTFES